MAREPKTRQRAAYQLPPGRHGFSREYVEDNQRQRILDAVAAVVSLGGYQAMSVEAVVATAGVSRRTFYDYFASKDDAFLTAYETIGGQLIQRVQAAYASSATFEEGVVGCLGAFLEFIASKPEYAELCIVEGMAAGPAALERRKAVLTALVQLVRAGADTLPERLHPPELTTETIVGGIYEIVYSRVLEGKTAELPELVPDLAYSMLLPYLGHEAAERAVQRLTGAEPDAMFLVVDQHVEDPA